MHQVAKILELQFPHHSGLISFRIDWFDLLAARRASDKGGLLPFLLQTHLATLIPELLCEAWSLLGIFFSSAGVVVHVPNGQ